MHPTALATASEGTAPAIVSKGSMKTLLTSQEDPNPDRNRMLSSSFVMKRLDYHCPKAFWRLVHAQGIPHVRYNARVIKFPEAGLEAWISEHRSAA